MTSFKCKTRTFLAKAPFLPEKGLLEHAIKSRTQWKNQKNLHSCHFF
ncbi:hypothetical protein D932_02884 [Enterococcus casseliflavus 14-MB-W-14]|nr:hypothetical protein D932_02884 [Enterococcus casseliflavus 14-MB-W-14]